MQTRITTNIDEVIKAIQAIEAKANDLSPVFAEIANHLYNAADQAFDDETSPDGTEWAPLADLTIKQKGHDRKLHNTGSQRETLIADSDKHSATVGTNAVSKEGYAYPAVMQFSAEDGKVPARHFLPFTEERDLMGNTKDSVLELVVAYFTLQFGVNPRSL